MATKIKRVSRAQRWADAVGNAMTALDELRDIQSEYQDWMDNLPENLETSPVGEKLTQVCDLDIDGAYRTVEEADSADLPIGFGRD